MPQATVFMDRDNTLIEDPGYLSDPGAIRLLPGVELALKSLKQAGYALVVVTNQSGIARGLLTEEALKEIHTELRRQLEEKGASFDAIYYCPYHPEGTVEAYAVDSELRKPKPGMLLQAAKEHVLDLAKSWMIGDSARDVEAGQRAGCRTIRLSVPSRPMPRGEETDAVQADFTARNLVDAAKIILRESGRIPAQPSQPETRRLVSTAMARAADEKVPEAVTPGRAQGPRRAPTGPGAGPASDRHPQGEALRRLRQLTQTAPEEFTVSKLIAGIVQVLALLALLLVAWRWMDNRLEQARLWAQIAMTLQVMALTFYMMHRSR